MSNELSVYKNNRINEERNSFNSNVSRLNNILAINIKNIKNNRRLKPNQKQQQINVVINQFNSNYRSLLNLLNTNISNIEKFKPKPIIINKNKKALLIGINYIGTSNQLNGCINDINCIKNNPKRFQ